MQVRRVLGHIGQGVVDLIINGHLLVIEVFQRDFGTLAEGHCPIAVEGPPRVNTDRQRVDLAVLAPAACEKVAHRDFDRGLGFAIPVKTQNEVAGLIHGRGGHPDLLNRARTVDLAKREGRLSGYADVG